MGRHDPDPGERFRHLLTTVVVLVLVAMVLVGITTLHALV
jgi:hypothetical protein